MRGADQQNFRFVRFDEIFQYLYVGQRSVWLQGLIRGEIDMIRAVPDEFMG